MEDLPAYSDRLNELIDRASLQVEDLEKAIYRVVLPKRLQEKEKQQQAPQPTQELRRRRVPTPPPSPPPVQEVRIRTERPPLMITSTAT